MVPTKSTFDLIDRWTAIHQLDDDFPYPENRIQNQDWIGMNKFLHEEGIKDEAKKIKESVSS